MLHRLASLGQGLDLARVDAVARHAEAKQVAGVGRLALGLAALLAVGRVVGVGGSVGVGGGDGGGGGPRFGDGGGGRQQVVVVSAARARLERGVAVARPPLQVLLGEVLRCLAFTDVALHVVVHLYKAKRLGLDSCLINCLYCGL